MSLSRVARLVTLSCLLLLAPSAIPAASAAGASPNLLLNPGFEDRRPHHPWMPAAWDTSITGQMSVFFSRDTFLARSGKYTAGVANLSSMFFMAHSWSQGLIVDRGWWGKDAVFSIWTRDNGLQGRAFIRAVIYQDTLSKMAKIWGVTRDKAADTLNIKPVDDPLLELGWKYQYFREPETDWVRREVRVFIPPTTNFLRLSAGLTGTGQVLLDDASLVLEPAQPATLASHVNLLADPGFEGDGTAWEYSLPAFPGIRVERDTTLSHSGRACMHYEDSGEGVNLVVTGVCQPIVNRALGGKRVRVSAWLKTDNLRGNANVAVWFKTPRRAEHPVPKLYSETMDWTLITLEGDAPDDTYEALVWFMYQSPSRGKVYFDDVSFEVLGDAPKPPRPPKNTHPAKSPQKKH